MTDGAQNAMLGYLYQFSLIASLRAYSVGDLPAGSGWRTLVGQIAGGQLTSEMFGQDGAAAVPQGERQEWVALQVKYSGDPATAIDLQFFVELLYSFDQSRQIAAAEGVDFHRYYVLTNLQPDSATDVLWRQRNRSDLERAMSRRKKKGKWPEWAAKLLKPYADEAEAFTRWSTVLARLEPVLRAPYQFGFEGLKRFAHRHGVLAPEFDRNLSTLAGQLVLDAAEGTSVEISQEWLKRHLVGASDVRDASFTASGGMLDAARARLSRRLEDVADSAHACLARRRYADDLTAKVGQHSVTFISGGGGSGKSVIALQHLLANRQGPIGVSIRAADVTRDAIPEVLRQLRSEEAGNALPPDTLEQAVRRIKAANPDRDVLLAVNIDAPDEADASLRVEISRIVRQFVEDGDGSLGGKLLVTCRPWQQKHRGVQGLILDWFDTEHPARYTDRVGLVEVGDFDEAEFEAAEVLLGDPPDERLGRGTDLSTFEGSESLGGDLGTAAVAPDLVRSLRHPVVWGAYVGLTREERRWVRSGRREGTDRLAEALVERFLRKCAARRNHLVQQHHLAQALHRVAAATLDATPPFEVQGVWQTACRVVLGDEGTGFLYREALTYGLIDEDRRPSWRWRHFFLAQYLARGDS